MDKKIIPILLLGGGLIAYLILRKRKPPVVPEPVSQWKFDEGEGDIAYDSQGLNNAITNGEWVEGALRFNGINTYAVTDISSSLNLYGGDVTIATWVRFNGPPAGATGYTGIYNYHGSGSGSGWYSMYRSKTNTLHMRIGKGYGEGDTEFEIGKWYFVACIYKLGEITQYVNNIKQNIIYNGIPEWGETKGSDISAFIGSYDETKEFLDGDIKNLRVWNLALTDKEILDIYNYEK